METDFVVCSGADAPGERDLVICRVADTPMESNFVVCSVTDARVERDFVVCRVAAKTSIPRPNRACMRFLRLEADANGI